MALFKRKSKPAEEPISQITQRTAPELIWTKSFTQSSNFRGFRRVKLRTHGEANVDDTLAFFRELSPAEYSSQREYDQRN